MRVSCSGLQPLLSDTPSIHSERRWCGLHASLPATAVGKDFRGLAGITRTSGGTGFQIETPLVGVKLGLKEGIEIHLLTLGFGVDFWPPALILPLGPGRLGFDDR